MNEQLRIQCGPADPHGRRLVIATLGARSHRGRFDTDNEFQRRKFHEAIVGKFNLPDDAHETIESQLLAAADSEDARAEATAYGSPQLTRLADVAPRNVEWLWPERIAIGKLTLLAGDPGLGKSFVSCDIAARVSTGTAWPDAPHEPQPPGGVVMLSAEDDLADTIRPRLDAHRADVERIIALEGMIVRDIAGDQRRGVDLSMDLPALEAAIERVADCRLVIVDPVSAYLGRTDSHNNAETRGMLEPLADLAGRRRVAILAVTHLRKGEGPAMYRAMGSLAFVAAARAAWLVCRDPQEPRRRLLLPVKNNLATDSSGLAYEITQYDGGCPVVAWEGEPVAVTADEALVGDRKNRPAGEALNEAAVWLRNFLAGGPKPPREVKEAAEVHAISVGTLRRAFKAIGTRAVKDGFQGPWVWFLGNDGEDAQAALPLEPCAPLEEPAHLWPNAEENNGAPTSSPSPVPKDAQVSADSELNDKLAREAAWIDDSF